jgi:hypothetical protein
MQYGKHIMSEEQDKKLLIIKGIAKALQEDLKEDGYNAVVTGMTRFPFYTPEAILRIDRMQFGLTLYGKIGKNPKVYIYTRNVLRIGQLFNLSDPDLVSKLMKYIVFTYKRCEVVI